MGTSSPHHELHCGVVIVWEIAFMLFNKPFLVLSQSIFFFKNAPLVLLIYSLRSRTISTFCDNTSNCLR